MSITRTDLDESRLSSETYIETLQAQLRATRQAATLTQQSLIENSKKIRKLNESIKELSSQLTNVQAEISNVKELANKQLQQSVSYYQEKVEQWKIYSNNQKSMNEELAKEKKEMIIYFKKNLETVTSQKAKIEIEFEAATHEQVLLKKNIVYLEEACCQLGSQRQVALNSNAILQEEKNSLTQQLKEAEEKINTLTEKLNNFQSIKKHYSDLKQQQLQLEKDFHKVTLDNKSYKDKIQILEQEKLLLERKNAEQQDQISKLEAREAELERDRQSQRKKRKISEKANAALTDIVESGESNHKKSKHSEAKIIKYTRIISTLKEDLRLITKEKDKQIVSLNTTIDELNVKIKNEINKSTAMITDMEQYSNTLETTNAELEAKVKTAAETAIRQANEIKERDNLLQRHLNEVTQLKQQKNNYSRGDASGDHFISEFAFFGPASRQLDVTTSVLQTSPPSP